MFTEPEDRWEPWTQPDVLLGNSGVQSLLCDDPPEDIPEARPFLGFTRGG